MTSYNVYCHSIHHGGFDTTEMSWILLLHGVMVLSASGTDFAGKEFPPRELTEREHANCAPWMKETAMSQCGYGGGSRAAAEAPYTGCSNHYSPVGAIGYIEPWVCTYEKFVPGTFTHTQSFMRKHGSEHFRILPPGGKSIRQLQQEADLRLKKIFFDSRENRKAIEEEIQKLRNGYGFGTIGYAGYRNSIRYTPIDLGTHRVIDFGGENGNSRLAVQTVRVANIANTLGLSGAQPYPAATIVSHIGDIAHTSSRVRQHLDAFGSEFSGETFPGETEFAHQERQRRRK